MQFGNQSEQDKFDAWFRQQLEHVAQYCFRREIFREEIKVESRWLIPHNILIGQAWAKSNPVRKSWVITGDVVPTDHAEGNVAETPRDAARYFALRWQLQGARVGGATQDSEQSNNQVDWDAMGKSLSEKAEMLYTFVNEDKHWQEARQ